jgi:D-alanyl-D-alanine carboxypeptidase/D-alanyl-D-alanine-endopeptidase (penicillin-binding protein 4)
MPRKAGPFHTATIHSAVVKLLRYMYDSPARDNWISLLPVGGQDGTLRWRFAENASRVHAKTGSLSHVSTLSGYAQRSEGNWVAFGNPGEQL